MSRPAAVRLALCIALAATLPVHATLPAQEPDAPIASGPPAQSPLPALRVYAAAGPDAGLEYDLAAAIGAGPGAVLFVHELTRNVAPLVRALDLIGDSHAPLGLCTAVVLLAEDRNEAERRVELASRSLRLARPIGVSVDGAEGPGAYALNRRATLTLVTAKDGKVVRSVAFTDTGRQDLGKLREWVDEVTGPLPSSPGELRAAALANLPTDQASLRARAAHLALELHWRARRNAEEVEDRARREGEGQPRRGMGEAAREAPGATPRKGQAPNDETLRELLRAAIQRDADAARLDDVFARIRTRAGESAELKAQGIAMLELMLSLEYGNAAARDRATAQLASWRDGR